jgi:hypothetical protein
VKLQNLKLNLCKKSFGLLRVHITKFIGIQKFLQEVDVLKPNAVAVFKDKGVWLGLVCAVLLTLIRCTNQ